MDLKSMLNKGGSAAAAQLQFAQHQANQRSHITSASQAAVMGHPMQQPLHTLSSAAHAQSYAQAMPMMAQNFQQASNGIASGYATPQDGALASQSPTGSGQAEPKQPVKAFACSTCSKGFARRSDLARHERIHSGHRPHVCDWPGCGKEFIQRSALTVHMRVHTGEKPHMCEHCTKPFSDSSSLARHRRIHSGKRPYKCPYVNCQKTFTRRTTLTRHQNSHTGTVEESVRATAAALASRPAGPVQRTQSENGVYSDLSNRNTPSPNGTRPVSMSPGTDIQMPQASYGYLPTPVSGGLPPHLRGEFGSNMHSPRSSPGTASPALSGFGQPPSGVATHHVAQMQARQPITSHPGNFNPPQPMEPAPKQEPTPNGSPHVSQGGWQSPATAGFAPGMHAGIQSAMQTGMQQQHHHHHHHAVPQAQEQYGFDQYNAFQAAPQMYGYPGSHIRRPQVTGPQEVWSTQTYA